MKNKYFILVVAMFLVGIPLISAMEEVTYKDPFDMVYLLVENTFGTVLLTAIGMMALFWFGGMWARMNQLTILYFCLLFAVTFAIGYLGAVAALPMGIFCIYYFFNGLKNWLYAGSGS